MQWDESGISRWLEPLTSRAGELAEVFGESLRETTLAWHDGEIRDLAVRREKGVGARWRHGREERLVYVPGTDEADVREAVRALRSATGREAIPIRDSRREDPEAEPAEPGADRWIRRLLGTFSRHGVQGIQASEHLLHALSVLDRRLGRRAVQEGVVFGVEPAQRVLEEAKLAFEALAAQLIPGRTGQPPSGEAASRSRSPIVKEP